MWPNAVPKLLCAAHSIADAMKFAGYGIFAKTADTGKNVIQSPGILGYGKPIKTYRFLTISIDSQLWKNV